MYKIFILLLLPFFVFAKNQVTTYFPLESFIVKKIGQKEIRIKEVFNRFIPEFKMLSPSDISRLSSVKIYFHFGMDIEKKYASILKDMNPELEIVDMSSGIKKINNNPYIWMDPILLRDVAKNVYDALVKLDKFNKDFYEKNYNSLLLELDKTFLKIKENMNKSSVFNVFVYDDYWLYFAKRFRLNLFKKDKLYINATQMSEIHDFAQKKSIKKILISKGDSYLLAKSLAISCNIPIIENEPFSELLLLNQITLVENLSD